ncbi:MAG: hypothetical protein AMJ46_13265 [Latescibacteria bacterium DG_63]|nr:MAG: hypothetical protein AMJ46_13265 [Latescibacteria bacterium DG_63]
MQSRVQELLERRQPADSVLDISLESLALGRAHCLLASQEGVDFILAANLLNRAVSGLQQLRTAR